MQKYVGADETEFLCHYGVKGMKWRVKKAIKDVEKREVHEEDQAIKKSNKVQRHKEVKNLRKKIKKKVGSKKKNATGYKKLSNVKEEFLKRKQKAEAHIRVK